MLLLCPQDGNALSCFDRSRRRNANEEVSSLKANMPKTKHKLVKIRSANQAKKYGIAAVNLKELIKKGCELLKVISKSSLLSKTVSITKRVEV